ncbi:MAG: DUF86 domain-containing protein [Cyanobacteria bacterium J06635_15]
MSRDQQSIQDIWNASQEILSFVAGMNFDALNTDRRTQAAVLYEIIVIGEAANRLSDTFQQKYSSIPWKEIIGMRNILAHQYEKVDSEVVWDVVIHDIPELIALIQPLLSTAD